MKTASPTTYDSVGDVIIYQIVATNTGNVTLSVVTVSDPTLGTLTCTPTQPATLAPGAAITCSGSHTITQADLDAGTFANTACANATGATEVCDTETVTSEKKPALSIVKTASPTTYDSVGDVISYQIVATNTGNVTLSNVTVSDPTLGTLTCTPTQPATLAPGAAITCSGSHTITQADLDAGTFANTACANATGATEVCDTETVTGEKKPALSIVKTASPTTYDSVGDVISYQIVPRTRAT